MTTSPSNRISRLNLFGALLIAETYSLYASFIAQSLKPVNVSVLDRFTHKTLPTGHIGNLRAVVDWHSFIATIAISIVVFAFAWSILSAMAKGRWLLTTDEAIIPNLAQERDEVQGEPAIANA
ncbi:MAG: hypothetical protein Q7S58_17080 [Candidatus Binatus sp.]|uniref:hypothetical protein n=1 Tax=Candidatus Binatus sp. TaxID=2811406 RepID=UPI002727DCB8|nr:hypothetical protein [Candidatus Binatus sp.]MDO8434114.1 hypothetical protein [Candidatus Binatus sp.]